MARRGPRVSFDQAGALGEPGVTASPCLSIPGRQGAMFSEEEVGRPSSHPALHADIIF